MAVKNNPHHHTNNYPPPPPRFQSTQDSDDVQHEGAIPMSTMISILTDYGDKDKRMTREEAEDLISSVAPQAQTGTFDYQSFIQMYANPPRN